MSELIRGEELPALIRKAKDHLQTPLPLCKLSDLPEYNDAEWLKAAEDLGLPVDGTYITKKMWEYTQLLYGLRRLDCLHKDSKALSVGSGKEPHLFYLANHIAEILAIDLFVDNPNPDIIEFYNNPEQFATTPYPAERLKLIDMDGRKLKFEDNSFDIIFSLSSIEHFGGNVAAAEAMSEIGRVLKPGGVAAIATELSLEGITHPECFTWSELNQYVIKPSNLQLVEDVNLNISDSLKEHYVNVKDIESPLYMLVNFGDLPDIVPFVSVMLFFRKPEVKKNFWQRLFG